MNTYGNEHDNDVIIDLYLYVIIDVSIKSKTLVPKIYGRTSSARACPEPLPSAAVSVVSRN